MFEIFFKIWFLIAILPILIFQKGYEMYKDHMKKNNRPLDSMYLLYALLAVLVIILIVLLVYGYPL